MPHTAHCLSVKLKLPPCQSGRQSPASRHGLRNSLSSCPGQATRGCPYNLAGIHHGHLSVPCTARRFFCHTNMLNYCRWHGQHNRRGCIGGARCSSCRHALTCNLPRSEGLCSSSSIANDALRETNALCHFITKRVNMAPRGGAGF